VIALRDLSAKRRRLYELSLAENRDEERMAALASQCDERLRQANRWSQNGEQSAGEMVAYPAIHVQALLARAQVLHANAKIHQAKTKSLNEANPAEAAREADSARAATEDAIAKLRQAVKTIEMPRAMTVGAEQERAEYFALFAPVFDLLVDLLYENGDYIEAIRVADTRRSRTFQDQLRASGVDLYDTADPKLVEAAKIASDRYYATLARLNENWANLQQRELLSAELETLRGEFVRAEQEVRSSSAAARQLLLEADESIVSGSSPRPNEWIGEWIGDDAVALVYYVGAANSYVFACGRELGVVGQMLTFTPEQASQRGLSVPAQLDSASKQLPLRADHVARLVRDVRAGAAKLPDSARREARATRGSQTLQLTVSTKVGPETDCVVTDILLPRELRQKIAEARPSHLIVVPDGALHELPLELLPYEPERKTYLLDTLPPISYAPSLHIHRRLRDDSRFGDWDVALVSLADPSYRQAATAGDTSSAEDLSSTGQEFLRHWRGGFARLEGFKKESDAVCAAFQKAAPNPGGIMPLVDKSATEEKLKNALDAHRIGFLHVAAHGLVSQEFNNLFGALALTPPDRPTDVNDGFLSLHEVFKLPLKGCEMVVLSACETNCGAESPLEAGSTMARAFICAGAKRIVCSHWEVDDVATTELVTHLMQQVSANLAEDRTIDFATALCAAKRELRHKTNSPYFWAPFVLVGPPTSDGAGQSRDTVAAQRN
jgi:CHAT domain-containing protein